MIVTSVLVSPSNRFILRCPSYRSFHFNTTSLSNARDQALAQWAQLQDRARASASRFQLTRRQTILLVLFLSSLTAGGSLLLLPSESPLRRRFLTYATGFMIIADYKYHYWKYSFQSFFSSVDPISQSQNLEKVHARSAQRYITLCNWHGGIYTKAGQFLASSPAHLVPASIRVPLSQLCDRAGARTSWTQVLHLLQEELGNDVIQSRFRYFEEQPIASASLAQVHRAITWDGRAVAVKIQYPHLRKSVLADVHHLRQVAHWVHVLFQSDYSWFFDKFEQDLKVELDFKQEAEHATRTAKRFSHIRAFRVPHIHYDLTSSRVLTMDYIEHAVRLNDTQGLKRLGVSPRQVQSMMVSVLGEMLFCHGTLHVDPHVGNWLVAPRIPSRHVHGSLLDMPMAWRDALRAAEIRRVKQRPTSPSGTSERTTARQLISLPSFELDADGTWHRSVGSQGTSGWQLVLLDHGLYRDLDEPFRQAFCQLWSAMIPLDSRVIQESGLALGLDKETVQYFPQMIFSPANENHVMNDTELHMMASLPHVSDDLLSVMRVLWFMRDLRQTLGGSAFDDARILIKWALRGKYANYRPDADRLQQESKLLKPHHEHHVTLDRRSWYHWGTRQSIRYFWARFKFWLAYYQWVLTRRFLNMF